MAVYPCLAVGGSHITVQMLKRSGKCTRRPERVVWATGGGAAAGVASAAGFDGGGGGGCGDAVISFILG
jgi:hypothetical protein